MPRPCPKCSCEEFTAGEPGPMPGEMRGSTCSRCGAKWWQPKAENERYRRPAAHRDLVKRYGRGICELCLRTREQLPGPESLVGHHVTEYAEGGTDDRANVWIVCTACHALVHHLRTYLGHYHRTAQQRAG